MINLTIKEQEYIKAMLKERPWMPDWAHGLKPTQLNHLDTLLSKTNCKIIIDIGCFIGGFTKIMAYHAKLNDGKVYSIDLFDDSTVALYGIHQNNDVKSMITRNLKERDLLEYVDIKKGISWEYAKEFKDDSVDFIFIDADHRYDSVKKDIINWLPKLKSGGIIAGHDYEFDTYDEQYINEDGHDDRHHGVIKAVNEIFGKVYHCHTIWSFCKK